MTRITGQQARELLKGTTPGPWAHSRIGEMSWIDSLPRRGGHTVALAVEKPEDASLLAAAPALAETVAWLYGREPEQGYTSVVAEWGLGDGFKVLRIGSMVTIGDDDKHIVFTLDEAEDAARSLLRAVEEARRG